jgi:hypothetical protein
MLRVADDGTVTAIQISDVAVLEVGCLLAFGVVMWKKLAPTPAATETFTKN